MKVSADQKIEGPDGYADWVDAWSDDYDVTARVDACLLGAGMYPGYENYWTTVQAEPDTVLPQTGAPPTPGEIAYARFAAHTPHYVLGSTPPSFHWPHTTAISGLEDVAALKQQPGADIYLVGGARTTASLMDAGLVDELRLIVYPLIAGEGTALFAATRRRRELELLKVEHLSDGRVRMTYGTGDRTGAPVTVG